MRRQITAFAIASMLMLGLASFGAAAASASTMPAEGVFEDCPIATQMVTCLQRLETMHAGGVNVVVAEVVVVWLLVVAAELLTGEAPVVNDHTAVSVATATVSELPLMVYVAVAV